MTTPTSRPAMTGQPVLMSLVGPPGAGKTTWRRAHAAGMTVVSLDELRAAVSCCSADPDANLRATKVGKAMARAALAASGTVLWDITAAEPRVRAWLLALAAEYHARTVAVVLLPPLPVALARNATRDATLCPRCGYARRVPDAVISRMHAAITADLPHLHAEGWHTVHRADLEGDRGMTRSVGQPAILLHHSHKPIR